MEMPRPTSGLVTAALRKLWRVNADLDAIVVVVGYANDGCYVSWS